MNSLSISILLVLNLFACRSEDAFDETVIKKIDLKNDNLDELRLDNSSAEKLNVSDPSLKNISDKLPSKDEEINLKKLSERDIVSKNDETKDILSSKLLPVKDSEPSIGSNGKTKDKKHKTDTKQTDEAKQRDAQVISDKKADDLPSFDEWKKKVVEEEPNNQQNVATINSSNKKMFQNSIQDNNKLRIRNYASSECGAKVINSNKEAQGSYKILSESQDEYMLNPCNSKIWFIIELCEAIKLSSIEVANYELFSSTFRDFLIYGSGHYPTRDWQLLGNFTANDIKQVQVFAFSGESEFRKFIKIEILSHHGSEHFCPFSLVRMFGTSMTDEFDALDGEKMMPIDESEILETDKLNENVAEKKYFNEKSVFYKILRKVAEFFYKTQPKRDRKDTKEENFARFLRDRDTLDAIIEQSVMIMMPTLEPRLKVCSNLESVKRKRNKQITFCNYLRSAISATTFDLLLKEMNKDRNLQFKCLFNPTTDDSSEQANKRNTTIGNQDSIESKLESSILHQKFDNDKLVEIKEAKNDYRSVSDSIKITTSQNSESLLLLTPTIEIKDERLSSGLLNEQTNDQTKSVDRSIELENEKSFSQTDDESKVIKSSEVMIDKPITESTATIESQLKIPEKATSTLDQSNEQQLYPSTDEETNGLGKVPIPAGQSKETLFVRMFNKIKTLELNLSLSSQYLEELSQRYRRQMDEMQKNFNQTIFKLNETSKSAAEKDNRQQALLDKFGSKIIDLERDKAIQTNFNELPPNFSTQKKTCIQDRDEAVASGRQCLKKCHQDSDCISARKRCLCDGLCGLSCVRPDLTCDLLKPIDNGSFTVTGDFFNAHVTYTCNSGFFISGLKERICQGDGSWAGNPPSCTKYAECGQPPHIPHARINPIRNSYKLESVVEYSCFGGYEAKGVNRTKCEFRNETIQWMMPEFKCIPRSCEIPDIENGNREINGNQFTVNRRVTFSCKEGFMIQGKKDVYCQSDGQWSSPLPHCTPILCPVPTNPKNGRAIFSNTIFQSITRFECLAGFELKGPSKAICNSTGEWANLEKVICDPINCEPIGQLEKYENVQIFVSMPSETTENSLDSNSRLTSFIGESDLGTKKWTIGTTLQFRCAGNAQLSSQVNYSRCNEDAQWSHPIPSCMDSCVMPSVANATTIDYNPGDQVRHGSSFQTVCHDKYEIVYQENKPICRNGTWSNLPTCMPEHCKQFPKAPRNGIVVAPYRDHNARGEFHCNDGFQIVGSPYTYCHFGKWITKKMPVCEEIFCQYPGTIENGRILLVGTMGLYEYKSYVKNVVNNRQVTYECDKGFQLRGPVGSTCLNSQWMPADLPKCVAYNYPPLIVLQSDFSRRRKRFIPLISNYSLELNKGTCLLLKTKNSSIHPKPYRTLTSSLIYLHGTKVSVDCANGYLQSLGSNQTAMCFNGYWKPATPICKKSKCVLKRIVENAVYFTSDKHLLTPNSIIEHDQLISINCLPGFRLIGANAVRCYLGELSAVFVHEVHDVKSPRKLCINCDQDRKEDESTIRWPICVPEKLQSSFPAINDWNLEKREIDLMIEDDADEIKKLKTNIIESKNEFDIIKTYRQTWCPKPTRLRSLINHIDQLKSANQLKSRLIGIVELDHNLKKIPSNGLVYPPGSQLLYRCINDSIDLFNEVSIENQTHSTKRSSWLITCSREGDWIGRRVPCTEYEIGDLI